jgi:hypothetical protein
MLEMIWPRGHGNTCAKRTSTHINHSVLFYYSKSQLAASDPYKFFFSNNGASGTIFIYGRGSMKLLSFNSDVPNN